MVIKISKLDLKWTPRKEEKVANWNLAKMPQEIVLGEDKLHIWSFLLCWEHKDIMWMLVSFDRKVTNPTIMDQREKKAWMPKGNHP